MAERKERRGSMFRSNDYITGAETIGNIEELFSPILKSLPARSLARFKCVSKHWLHVISNLKTYIKISAFFSSEIEDGICFKSIPLGINNPEISSGWNPFKKFIDSLEHDTRSCVIQASNGLFLCLGYPWDPYRSRVLYGLFDNDVVYVVNPTTYQFLALSSPSIKGKKNRYFVRYGLAFDPSISPYYKVVCVTDIFCNEEEYHKVDIYSSETRFWYKHLEIPPSNFDMYGPRIQTGFDTGSSIRAVYCNGVLHWRRRGSHIKLDIWSDTFICREIHDVIDMLYYFDITQERLMLAFTRPPVPTFVKSHVSSLSLGHRYVRWPILACQYFGECGGRLYLIEISEKCKTQFDVMEMGGDYSGWFIKYHVDLSPIVDSAFPGHKLNYLVVLDISRDNDDEDSSAAHILVHMPGEVISYNLKNKTFKTTVEFASKKLQLLSIPGVNKYYTSDFAENHNFPYMESLACL